MFMAVQVDVEICAVDIEFVDVEFFKKFGVDLFNFLFIYILFILEASELL